MQPRPDSPNPLFWRRSTVCPDFFGWYPRSSLHSFVPFAPPLSPSLIIHLASVDVKQNGPGPHLSVRGEGGIWPVSFHARLGYCACKTGRCVACLFLLSWCFTSTETVRLIRDGERWWGRVVARVWVTRPSTPTGRDRKDLRLPPEQQC